MWHQCWPVPDSLPIHQVYAWVVNEAGRTLLIRMPGGWNLPGGTPEGYDGGWEATLHREVLEEAGITVRDVRPLGYQEVQPQAGGRFAQVRAAARVCEWQDARPDPDTGLVYPRVWVPLRLAAGLLGWGKPGMAQAAAAAQVAREIYGFTAAAVLAQGASVDSTPVMQVV